MYVIDENRTVCTNQNLVQAKLQSVASSRQMSMKFRLMKMF